MPASTPARWTDRLLVRRALWVVPLVVVVLAVIVLVAIWIRSTPAGRDFIGTYSGFSPLPAGTAVGIPVWLEWQHFLNSLFIILIIRTGWQVRTTRRPTMFWTRKNTGAIRTKNPPRKISLTLWLHLSLDVLWMLNGVVFYVLLFSTGQWARIVPVHWNVFPNAVSALLQYASFNWPAENGWSNYNSLQLLAYFVTVFIAAPLAILSGVRMSSFWPRDSKRMSRAYPVEVARAIHFPVMIYFVAFVIVHVTLVATTGVQRNLNHMYAARNDESLDGVWIFAISVLVIAGLWLLARPILLRPVAELTGKVGR
ncbi:MAG TPA: cytochrome b/b6 domain-containing protein [Galbitalea sp.]|jgi:thiosulfate reductase cytochrome b subunit|nr:cytochrome b/b6 domain-containing protein [Galbitalea sp.]